MKPHFLVAGFSKCGTTSLCSVLDEHPQLCLCKGKECNFFLWNFRRGWQWYDSLFAGATVSQLRGDGSVFCTAAKWERAACRRIAEHCPDIRMIWIARNPLKRLESSYRENHHSGHLFGVAAPYSIGALLREFPNIVEDTLYWQRINTYRAHFPDDQFHVLFLEDWMRDPAGELAKICEFLGVAPMGGGEKEPRQLNAGSTKLFDSRQMRFVRKNKVWNGVWSLLPVDVQNRLGRQLGLRRPFKGPIQWEPADLEWALSQIVPDTTRFLEFYGKPADFWSLDVVQRSAA